MVVSRNNLMLLPHAKKFVRKVRRSSFWRIWKISAWSSITDSILLIEPQGDGIFSRGATPPISPQSVVSAWIPRRYKKWRPWGAIFITCHSDARPTIPHFMNKFQGALQPRNELEEQHLVLPVNPASIPPRAWHYQPGPHWTNYVQEEFPVNWNEFKIWEEYH